MSAGNGTTSNSSAITFPTASGGDWGTISYVAITDNPTFASGNMWFYGSLTVTKVVTNGDTFQFATSQLSIQLDN